MRTYIVSAEKTRRLVYSSLSTRDKSDGGQALAWHAYKITGPSSRPSTTSALRSLIQISRVSLKLHFLA